MLGGAILCVLLFASGASGFRRSRSPPLRPARPLQLNIPLSGSLPTVDAVLCVAAVVAFHEAGHFLAAKVQRIKIDSYNIGYGPKVLSYKGKEEGAIDYSLRLLPFGGYVSFPSNVKRDEETGEVTELSDPDLLENRPPLQKALVIASGVIANLLLAFLLAAYSSLSTGISRPIFGEGVTVVSVSDTFGANSPAKAVQLLPNDIIVAVSDASGTQRIATNDVPRFVSYVRAHPSTEISLEVRRGALTMSKKITPLDVSGKGQGTIGVNVNANVVSFDTVKALNIAEAAAIGLQETIRLLQATVNGLVQGLTNGFSAGNIGGPISIVREGARIAESSPRALVGFAAALSVNLAVLNSLPVPALDGGQFVFVAIEQLTGKKLPRTAQENVYIVAFVIFMALTATAFVNDIGGLGASFIK